MLKPKILLFIIIIFNFFTGLAHSDDTTLLEAARKAAKAGKNSKAVKLYLDAAKATPDDPTIWKELGDLYLVMDKRVKAFEAYDKYVELNPTDFLFKVKLSQMKVQHPEHDSSDKTAAYYYNEGKNRFYLKKYRKAVKYFKIATEQDPGNYEYWQFQGICYLQLYRDKKALRCALKAYELEPKDIQVLKLLGNAYREKGYWKRAIETYNEAIKYYPTEGNLKQRIPWTYRLKGDLKRARESFDSLLVGDPDNPHPYRLYANLEQALDLFPAAYDYYEKALSRDPSNYSTLENLATLNRQWGFKPNRQFGVYAFSFQRHSYSSTESLIYRQKSAGSTPETDGSELANLGYNTSYVGGLAVSYLNRYLPVITVGTLRAKTWEHDEFNKVNTESDRLWLELERAFKWLPNGGTVSFNVQGYLMDNRNNRAQKYDSKSRRLHNLVQLYPFIDWFILQLHFNYAQTDANADSFGEDYGLSLAFFAPNRRTRHIVSYSQNRSYNTPRTAETDYDALRLYTNHTWSAHWLTAFSALYRQRNVKRWQTVDSVKTPFHTLSQSNEFQFTLRYYPLTAEEPFLINFNAQYSRGHHFHQFDNYSVGFEVYYGLEFKLPYHFDRRKVKLDNRIVFHVGYNYLSYFNYTGETDDAFHDFFWRVSFFQ